MLHAEMSLTDSCKRNRSDPQQSFALSMNEKKKVYLSFVWSITYSKEDKEVSML